MERSVAVLVSKIKMKQDPRKAKNEKNLEKRNH